jgi:hypothetical protein
LIKILFFLVSICFQVNVPTVAREELNIAQKASKYFLSRRFLLLAPGCPSQLLASGDSTTKPRANPSLDDQDLKTLSIFFTEIQGVEPMFSLTIF